MMTTLLAGSVAAEELPLPDPDGWELPGDSSATIGIRRRAAAGRRDPFAGERRGYHEPARRTTATDHRCHGRRADAEWTGDERRISGQFVYRRRDEWRLYR